MDAVTTQEPRNPPDHPSTSLQALAAAQDAIDTLKGEFLATVNHELRTPLSGVLGMADLLAETSLSDEQKDYLLSLKDCALELLGSLNSILEYSSWSAGNFRLDHAEFALRHMVDGLARETRTRLEGHPISFSVAVDPDVPEIILGDEIHLRQAIGHLLANSVKFTSSGSISLHVSTARAGREDGVPGSLRFSVRDTGIGIGPNQLGVIFDSFRQADAGLARLYRGLGLGLTLAKAIAEAMGGEIAVHSREGQGSVFELIAPFPGARKARLQTARPGPPGCVLMVDDNQIAQAVVGHALRKGGYQVEFAGDGPRGLAMAGARRYDLVLMDLQMPEMDGFETANRIRAIEGYAGVPIVALTANYSDEQRTVVQKLGMQGYIGKPVRREELVDAVQKHIAEARRAAG